ncbi:MAG: hypothetical protein OEY36_06830 [Gammaproteobacteria bacterium]|nr:hypothetical protein [Gammaproteobacteria bacterium]
MKKLIVLICLGFINISCDSGSDSNLGHSSAENLTASDFNVVPTTEVNSNDLRFELFELIRDVPEFDPVLVLSMDDGTEPEGCVPGLNFHFDAEQYLILSFDDFIFDIGVCSGNGLAAESTLTMSLFTKIQFYDQSGSELINQIPDASDVFDLTGTTTEQRLLNRGAIYRSPWTQEQISDISIDYPTLANELESGDGFAFLTMHSTNGFHTPCVIYQDLISNCIREKVERRHSFSYSSSTGALLHTELYHSRYVMHDLVPVVGAPFYESGTLEFEYENWSGTITFNGAHTSPSFVANSADESIAGVIEAYY